MHITAKHGDDLFLLSGSRELYNDYAIEGIDCTTGMESVTTIGVSAFEKCSSLQTVYLPDNSETTYGEYVFNGVTCPIVAATKEQ